MSLRWIAVPLLSLAAVASIGAVVAAAIKDSQYAIAMSVPAGFLLMLWLALRASAAFKPLDNSPPHSPSPTPWRLIDPSLSHWGVWRADLGRLAIETAGPRANHRQIKAYIRTLLDDWSRRSARGGRVVEISRPVTPLRSPFGEGPNGWKVYRIALDDGLLRRTGWLRFGRGWVEFQLQRHPSERELLKAPPRYRRSSLDIETRLVRIDREILEGEDAAEGPGVEIPVTRNPFLNRDHPMWDRWIDL
jgi:hypothetical protein